MGGQRNAAARVGVPDRSRRRARRARRVARAADPRLRVSAFCAAGVATRFRPAFRCARHRRPGAARARSAAARPGPRGRRSGQRDVGHPPAARRRAARHVHRLEHQRAGVTEARLPRRLARLVRAVRDDRGRRAQGRRRARVARAAVRVTRRIRGADTVVGGTPCRTAVRARGRRPRDRRRAKHMVRLGRCAASALRRARGALWSLERTRPRLSRGTPPTSPPCRARARRIRARPA